MRVCTLCVHLCLFQPFQDEIGESALHVASGKGHVEVIIVILQKGGDVNILTKVGVWLFSGYTYWYVATYFMGLLDCSYPIAC